MSLTNRKWKLSDRNVSPITVQLPKARLVEYLGRVNEVATSNERGLDVIHGRGKDCLGVVMELGNNGYTLLVIPDKVLC